MRSFLRPVVLACLVAGVLPQAAAAAEALHVLLDHGEEHGRAARADAMVPALHGHAHAAETPGHDHPLTAPTSGSVASRTRGPSLPALPVGFGEARASRALADVRAAGGWSAIQRPAPVIPTVLRI
jgi:hypothetical protein